MKGIYPFVGEKGLHLFIAFSLSTCGRVPMNSVARDLPINY